MSTLETIARQIQHLTQTPMGRTEIVYRTHHIHSLLESFGLTEQATSAPYQGHNARPKSAIQSFYISYMSLCGILSLLKQQLDLLLCPLTDATDYSHYTFCGVFLNHLDNADIIPLPQIRSSQLASENRSPKHLLYCRHIRQKAISAKQQWAMKGTTAHLLHQTCYQIPISTGTYCTTKPEASGNPKRHSHPDYATLVLDPYLICLYLTQFMGLSHQVFMNLLAMQTGTALPGSHRAFIQTKGSYYSCCGTAIGK
jgi:hypothetical protein